MARVIATCGGLRIGELAGLRRNRVDLPRGTVTVAEIVVEVRGVLHVGPPKTRASRRTVGLPRFVVEELAAHLVEPGDPESFVFTAPQGGPLRVTGFRARVWRPATRAAGLEGLRIHDLRHTAVALWIAAGANLKEVAARAAHASVSLTLDRYGHLYPEADTALCDRLDALDGSALPASEGSVEVRGFETLASSGLPVEDPPAVPLRDGVTPRALRGGVSLRAAGAPATMGTIGSVLVMLRSPGMALKKRATPKRWRSKEAKEIVAAVQQAGGRVERTASGHLKVIGPAGSAIVASAPNTGRVGGRAVHNTLATIRSKTGLEV